MGTLLLSGAAKRLLSLVLLCCLWGFTAPADARAANPAFGNPTCTVQSVTMGATTTWQIRGQVPVNNLPAGMTSTTVKFQFEKKANGAPAWAPMFTVTQYAGSGGTVNFDTGWQTFTPAPAAGDQYRILVSGSWSNTGPPPTNGNLNPVGSTPITPVP